MQIKPCPFCGNSIAPMVADENQLSSCDCLVDNPYYAVVCCINSEISTPHWIHGCGASGGFAPSKQEAIILWNIRTEAR